MQVKPWPRIRTVGLGGKSGVDAAWEVTKFRIRFVVLEIMVDGLKPAANPAPVCSFVTSNEWRGSEDL